MNISTIQRYRREGSGRAAVAGTAASAVKVNFSLLLTESRGYQMGQSGGCDHPHARKKPRHSPVSSVEFQIQRGLETGNLETFYCFGAGIAVSGRFASCW